MRPPQHACMTAWQYACIAACTSSPSRAARGGAGKTTLASHLSVQAQAAGAGPVALIDTDPQGGLAGWWNAREAQTPHWIDPALGLPATVTAARDAGYGVLIIDTPPLRRRDDRRRDRGGRPGGDPGSPLT